MEIKYPQWSIDNGGNLCYNNAFGCEDYTIEKHRLAEANWILHLLEKEWVDMNDFIPAYFVALAKAGKQKVTVLTCYHLPGDTEEKEIEL
jgi:hypothetical protein